MTIKGNTGVVCDWMLVTVHHRFTETYVTLSKDSWLVQVKCVHFPWVLQVEGSGNINVFFSFFLFAGPVRYIVQGLSLIRIGRCYSVFYFLLLCGCMIIGQCGSVWLYFWYSHWSESVGGHKTSTVAVGMLQGAWRAL